MSAKFAACVPATRWSGFTQARLSQMQLVGEPVGGDQFMGAIRECHAGSTIAKVILVAVPDDALAVRLGVAGEQCRDVGAVHARLIHGLSIPTRDRGAAERAVDRVGERKLLNSENQITVGFGCG